VFRLAREDLPLPPLKRIVISLRGSTSKARDSDEFNDVEPAFATLLFGNKGLRFLFVTMQNGDSIQSGSNGINAINTATSILASAGSVIAVTTAGSIHSGTVPNNNGTSPNGIAAGYLPGGSSTANLNVNGSVIINNAAANVTTDPTSTGSIGILAFNWGNGNITVNDASGTTVSGTQYGIDASANAAGTGNVAINVYANATVSSTASYGIFAVSKDAGNISVITSSGDVISAGSVGTMPSAKQPRSRLCSTAQLWLQPPEPSILVRP
jgi:hypothetical protein